MYCFFVIICCYTVLVAFCLVVTRRGSSERVERTGKGKEEEVAKEESKGKEADRF